MLKGGHNRIDLAGRKIGKWTVLEYAGIRKNRSTYWLCRCECGTVKEVRATHLRNGKSTRCNKCNPRNEQNGKFRHGARYRRESRLTYSSWSSMMQRCTNPRNPSYPDYGKRGISVHPPWRDFVAFRADMGERPPGTTLERRNVNGNYEPDNCIWADKKTQQANRRCVWYVMIDGVEYALRDLYSRAYRRDPAFRADISCRVKCRSTTV
jgi:hypothetical protein